MQRGVSISEITQKPESSHFLPTAAAGKYTVRLGSELCSSDPETHKSNCSSWPLGLPLQCYDLFRSDHGARLIRTPKRRRQYPQAKKSSPERAATNAPSGFHRRSCNSNFYTWNKRICLGAPSWFLLSPWKCTINLTKVTSLRVHFFSDLSQHFNNIRLQWRSNVRLSKVTVCWVEGVLRGRARMGENKLAEVWSQNQYSACNRTQLCMSAKHPAGSNIVRVMLVIWDPGEPPVGFFKGCWWWDPHWCW